MAKMKHWLIRRHPAATCLKCFFHSPLTNTLLSVFILNVGRFKSINRTLGVGRALVEEEKHVDL